ncbi:CPBP family glutamic-type intramembrane protease [Paenibacillus segetis]|uniref:Membrane protein n=1 Tax=Paenibacillus segetis TaxID=1325360 RepID=A0ABQ1Y4A4_9BACL|nr:CPBP family glutamic-type intramembrane protease [Paenibacillus segetis]GGH11382.1 membrane protein [Paenibacillus segetis]
MTNKVGFKLTSLLVGLMCLWGLAAVFKMMVIWFLLFGVVSVVYIIKNKNTTLRDIMIGCVLGIIAMPASVFMGVSSILIYIGATSMMKGSSHRIILIKNATKRDVVISCITLVLVGVVLGGINVLLGLSSNPINPSFQLSHIFEAIKAGVTEEIMFRYFLFALCVVIAGDHKFTKLQNVLCYLIMVLPHVFIHFELSTINIGNIIVLSLLFGLPFAWLQRKRDLVSAMGSHSIVDIIRFCLFSA